MSVILCTAGYDHTIRFWEALSGICSRTIQHPESQVNRLCITPDKKFLAAAGRHVVRLYDIKSTNPNPIMQFEGHTNNITGVAFHCEGKWMVTSSEDMTVKVWDTRSGVVQRNYQCTHPVNDVVIHPNQGELVSADRGGNIRIWDLGESKCTHQLIPEEDVSVSSVSVASDGSLLAAGNNKGNVYIWRMYQNQDSTTLSPCRVFKAHKDYLTRLLLSPDSKLLATCSADHTVRIWKIDMAEEHLEAAVPYDAGTPTTPSASQLSLNHQNNNDDDDNDNDNSSEASNSMSSSASTTSASAIASTTGFNNAIPAPPPAAPSNTNSNSTSSPHHSIASDTLTTLFRGPSSVITHKKPLPSETVLENHQRWVWDCAFSADSAYLVTVCSDHFARLWELNSSTIIRQYNGHHRGAVCVALNDYSDISR